MKKEIEISIPQSYADITLKEYLELQKELKNYEDNEEAQTAIMVTYLCDLDINHLAGMSKEDFEAVKIELSKFISNTEYPLQTQITIDGIEYGFEPNLSEIAYGAFIDITKYDTIEINENWAKIMDILYRPIINKQGSNYNIKAYDGKIDDSKWYNVGMDVHFGTLFFFVHLSTDLTKSILNYTKGLELPQHIKSILEKSGEAIKQSWNFAEKISPK